MAQQSLVSQAEQRIRHLQTVLNRYKETLKGKYRSDKTTKGLQQQIDELQASVNASKAVGQYKRALKK